MPASANNTILQAPGSVITDAAGNTWQLQGGQVVVNGVVDQTTGNVVLLAYEHGTIWQENASRLWWSKTDPSAAWGPTYGTPDSPLVGVASANNTVLVGSVVAGPTHPGITDANDDKWTITAGGQVAVNGVVDTTTARVIALAYENGQVWQENADRAWWSKSRASDSWSPTYGTTQSPIPAGAISPTVNYITGAVVDYTNTVSPAGYVVEATAETPVTFNYQGTNLNNGTIGNGDGELIVNVQGSLINAGTLMTKNGILNSNTKLQLSAGSTFDNTGVIATMRSGPQTASTSVTGAGTFRNDGTMTIAGGSSSDFNMTGTIINAGRLSIDDSFGTSHAMLTSGSIVNTGVIENHNQTTIQWGYSGPPVAGAANTTFTNNGVIEGLNDVSQLTLSAGVFVHAADGYTVRDYHGTLANNGQILAAGGGGRIEIAAPLVQSAAGHIDIQGGATVQLDSTSDGGTINITSGMLAFGGGRIAFHGPAGATGLHSDVVLGGATAAFDFARADISAVFTASSSTGGDLSINLTGVGAPEQIADIHLVGSYHASQFTVSGDQVLYRQAG